MQDVAAGGYLLANDRIPQVPFDTLLAISGYLGDRLMTAMNAALAAGGQGRAGAFVGSAGR